MDVSSDIFRAAVLPDLARGMADNPGAGTLMDSLDDITIFPPQPHKARLKERYRIERELARGGLGVVYLARDEALHDRPVVVKMPLAALADRPWIAEKFAQEVKALASIDHPGVVGALDSGITPAGNPFLVMQYVEGRTLKDAIPAEGLPLGYAAHLLRQIGHALAAAHARNVWHRDLKPANIMLQQTEDGGEYARLIDFGIASARDSLARSETRTTVAGTLPYMAPEQLEGRVSAASDVYAFAVIAYEMTTGRRPFVADDSVALLKLQKAGPSLRPSQLRPSIPAAAERLILQGLALRSEDRPRGVASYADAMAQLLNVEDAPVEPRSRRTVAFACASVVILAAMTAGWWMMHGHSVTEAALKTPVNVGRPSPQLPEDGLRASAGKSAPEVPTAASAVVIPINPANAVVLHGSNADADVPPKPKPPPTPRVSRSSTPANPASTYGGPTEGRLVWTGDLQPGQQVDLGAKEFATAVSGSLPGVPVAVEVHPASVKVVVPPSPASGWRQLVVRNDGKKQVVILVKWTVLSGREGR